MNSKATPENRFQKYLGSLLADLSGLLGEIDNARIPQLQHLSPLIQNSIKNAKSTQNALQLAAVSSPPKSPRKPKDPNAPKQPLTSYLLFCGDVRESIKVENPSWSQKEVAIEMGKRWSSLNADQKKTYEEQAAVKRGEYNAALKTYREQNGMGDHNSNQDLASGGNTTVTTPSTPNAPSPLGSNPPVTLGSKRTIDQVSHPHQQHPQHPQHPHQHQQHQHHQVPPPYAHMQQHPQQQHHHDLLNMQQSHFFNPQVGPPDEKKFKLN